MTHRAREVGRKGGWAIDLAAQGPITGRSYDLRCPADQRLVRRLLQRDRPEMLVVSPPCTLFSIANTTGRHRDAELQSAIEMVRFALELCLLQLRAGRHFIFEHPLTSRAWSLPCMKWFTEQAGVMLTSFDQCQFGHTTSDSEGLGYVYKPTRFATSCPANTEIFSRRCPREHRHVPLVGSRATQDAAV